MSLQGLSTIVEFGEFRLDPVKRLLTNRNGPVTLAPKAVDVLCVLVAKAPQTVEKNELLREVWGSTVVEENTLVRNILLIRKALGEHAGSGEYISTVAGRGYRFVHEVRSAERESVTPAKAVPRRPLAIGLAATLLLIAAGGAAGVWWRHSKDGNFVVVSMDYATRSGNVLTFAVSRDSRMLVYVSGLRTRQSLHVKDLVTSRETELLPDSGLHYMGITVHESTVYFAARDTGEQAGSLYRMPLAGGRSEKLFSGTDSPVSFSPDGRLAFVREDRSAGESRLMVSQPDGSQAAVLAAVKLPSYLDYPDWSPDGRRIVTTRIDREDNHVVVFDATSGSARRLGGRWGFPMHPRWMPDGGDVILIARERDRPVRQVWSVTWPAGQAKAITGDLDEYVDLQVTGDGKSLLALNRKMATTIWTGPASDPDLARQIGFGTDGKAILAWTRAGRLVYESGGKMWSIAPDGSGRTQLTLEGESYHPSACRESGELVFIHETPSGMFFDVVGSDERLQHRIPVRKAAGPECSPDGRWITYVDGRKQGSPLVRLDVDTGVEIVLNSTKTAAAAVSPDGTRLAQLTEEPDELRVLPASGGAPQQSFSLPTGTSEMPGVVRWTPDGKGIAYVDRSGAGNVWIQRLEGGSPQPYTKLNNERVLSFDWSNDGKQIGMIRAAMVQDVVAIRRGPGT